jgi:hypothetical protein
MPHQGKASNDFGAALLVSAAFFSLRHVQAFLESLHLRTAEGRVLFTLLLVTPFVAEKPYQQASARRHSVSEEVSHCL